MQCPICNSEMEVNLYSHGFHPAGCICPECGYETDQSEIETLRLFIEQLENASISGCNSEAMQFRYKMEAKWLNELLKIKEEN